jgi:membrane protease YdiL (CAAX protease family)
MLLSMFDAPPSKPRSRWPALLSWFVIAAITTLTAYGYTIRPSIESTEIRDMANKFRGQFLLSLKGVSSSQSDLVLQQMESEAQTPEDRVAAAIMAAEIEGGRSAMEKLEAIERDSPTPEVAADVEVLQKLYSEDGAALDPGERHHLTQRHGYFGRIALAYNVEAAVEPRKSLESDARQFSVRVVAVAIGILVLGFVAFVMFVAAVVLLGQGRIVRKYQSDPSVHSAFLEAFALYMVVFFLLLGPLRRYLGLTSLSWEWLGLFLFPVIYGWLVWRGNNTLQIRTGLGWHRGKGILREIGAGLCGYLAGLPVLVAGVLITFILARSTGTTAGHPVVQLLGGGGWHLLLLYLTVSVYAPVLEESMFRGSLFHHLRRRWNWLLAAAIASFIFAILHPQGLAAIPALGANGLVLNGIREWRGSLIASATAHAFNNFLAITIASLILA